MLHLQKNIQYLGDAEKIVSEFPELANLQMAFELLTYNLIDRGEQADIEKKFFKNEILAFQLSIKDTTYSKNIKVDIITGKKYELYLKYYAQVFKSASIRRSVFSFFDYLSVKVTTKVNNEYNNSFSALPLILATGDISIIAPEQNFNNNIAGVPQNKKANSDEAYKKYLENNLVLLNNDVLQEIIKSRNDITITHKELIVFLTNCIKINSKNEAELAILDFDILQDKFKGAVENDEIQFNGLVYEFLIKIIPKQFDALLNFPIDIPEIKPVAIKGNVKFITDDKVIFTNLTGYDLFVEADINENEKIKTISQKYKWNNFTETEMPNNTAAFDFHKNNNLTINANNTKQVIVSLKLFDGAVIWSQKFSADDAQLSALKIEVPFFKINNLNTVNKNDVQNTKLTLKGKVVDATGKCSLKDLTIIIQAKVKKEDVVWKVVGMATSDITGSFSMRYPLGNYEVAQAIVSLAPNSPVDITLHNDEAHKAILQTISNEFLYLLVDASGCKDASHTDDNCDCHSTSSKTPRLPGHEELIGSDKFSQDLGGGSCVNLTTPNRTLSESTYYAIVRTSDPHVANYTLQKTSGDADINQEGFMGATFELVDGGKFERQEVSYNNPIRWQDAPNAGEDHLSIYQAVTVAHGHLLTYKSALKADGYSLGDLLYSLPLAPGQKKQIVVYDWNRTLQGTETQQTAQGETLSSRLTNDREIIDNLQGSINEQVRGRSSASTSGMSGGFGIGAILGPVGMVLGVSGGYSKSSSSAAQDSSRQTAQSFHEVLRNTISQSASSYRELNASVIHAVTEGQQFSTTTEVVANHNHCHSLTMLYFEVLRHYAVYQELAEVSECMFVPLIMTNFSRENIHKWRDVLADNLLYRASNTYLPYYTNKNPLVKAFDANERVRSNWANVDFPAGRYCDEVISNIKGEINIRVDLPRPKTKYDRIKSFPIVTKMVGFEQFDLATAARSTAVAALTGGLSLLFGGSTTKTVTEQILVRSEIFDAFMKLDANYATTQPANCIRVIDFSPKSLSFFGMTIPVSGFDFFENGINDKIQWEAYASILGYAGADGVFKMLNYYFAGKLIAEWDDIFYNDIAPLVFEKIMKGVSIENMGIDISSSNRYKGGERTMQLTFQGLTNLKRIEFPNHIKIKSNNSFAKNLKDFIILKVEYLKIGYATQHFDGHIYNGWPNDSLLEKDTDLYIPLSNNEKKDPRKDDRFIVNELIIHLNANLEHYNKVLWYNLDIDRRYLLLDGFHIQVYNDLNEPAENRSLASLVKNELIGIAGNALIFPVAAGVKLDRSYIVVRNDNEENKISLFDHYKPLTPASPYRISVPTRGIYAEALMGACDSCEKVQDNTSQDWEKFKTDEPTAIGTVTVPTPTPTDWKAAFKDFAPPMINIQNAPAAPAPGAGLAGLNDLLGKNNIFKDITGLEGNQKNAMATYLSNQENAKAFASMAKDMATQGHNTANADKIQGAIDKAQSSGAISKEEANKLTNAHLQQMIDGGESKKLDAANASATKPTLTDAAVKAAEQGKAVKAENTNAVTGKTEKVEIAPTDGKLKYDFMVPGAVESLMNPANAALIKQPTPNACWATVTNMLMMWKKQMSNSINEFVTGIGAEFIPFITSGIPLDKLKDFNTKIGLKEFSSNQSVDTNKYYDLLQKHGPLWVIDLESNNPKMLHGRLLIGIKGNNTPDSLKFTIIDPATGQKIEESGTEFFRKTANVVKTLDAVKDIMVPNIIHFADTYDQNKFGVNGGGVVVGGGGTLWSDENAFKIALNNNKSEIINEVKLFADGLRNMQKETDVTLQYGQFSVINTVNSHNGKNYQTSNFQELLNLAYSKNIISKTELFRKVVFADKSQAEVDGMFSKESVRCFQTAKDVAQKYYDNTKVIRKNFQSSSFGGAIAGVVNTPFDSQEILRYSSQFLPKVYADIENALKNNQFVIAGVMSGKKHDTNNKFLSAPNNTIPNPEHFLLIFKSFKIDNIPCFLFWDSDHITTNFSTFGMNVAINSIDAAQGNINDGFGILFGLDKSFSTAFNEIDLRDIGETPFNQNLGDGYHQILKDDLIRHRYQVYSIDIIR